MKIYDLELSGHSHRARLFASLLGLKPEIVPVDLMSGAHKKPEFLAKNPFGQVPALEDGDVSIFDSNAILVYLATQYDADRTWLPSDAESAAKVQAWLSKAANELANSVAAARLITVFGAKLDQEALHKKSAAFLQVVNSQLENKQWLVGTNPTIADVALYTYIAHAPEGGIDLRVYPNISNWLKNVEALPGFIPMTATETDAKKALAL